MKLYLKRLVIYINILTKDDVFNGKYDTPTVGTKTL